MTLTPGRAALPNSNQQFQVPKCPKAWLIPCIPLFMLSLCCQHLSPVAESVTPSSSPTLLLCKI